MVFHCPFLLWNALSLRSAQSCFIFAEPCRHAFMKGCVYMSIEKLKYMLRERAAAALIMSEDNVRYFTSFSSTNGYLLVTGENAFFLTDSRYIEAARKTIKTVDGVLLFENFKKSLVPLVNELSIKTLSVEGARITVKRLNELKKELSSVDFETEKLDGEIDLLRAVKSREECRKIIEAQRIAEKALEMLLPKIRVGAVERELSLELDYTMLKLGAQALSFETIAVSGKNGSMPHGIPGDKKIESGDFITFDFGAVYKDYHSDMTRTFAVGAVSDKQRDVYETVLRAQKTAIDAVCAGKKCSDIDKVARDIIAEKGYGEYFGHGLGHGVGVEIHEFPSVSPRSSTVLEAGHIITIEPGIYIPGEFGVRIEDMLYVTEDGFINLTECPKELRIL